MLRHRSLILCAAAAALGIILVVGCSTQPTAPMPSVSTPGVYTSPSFVTVPHPQTASALPDSGLSNSLTVTQSIDGLLGGQVTAGRFRVTIPPAAFLGVADITVYVPDQGVMHCFLDINPISLNLFAVPVVLEANCAGGSVVSAEDLAVVRFEPTMSAWRTVGVGSPADTSWTVQAALEHFSEYGVVDTKAGW